MRHFLALLMLLVSVAALGMPVQAATSLESASMILEEDDGKPKSAPQEVALPYNWDSEQGGREGKARFRMHFSVTDPGIAHAMLIPRVGNTFEIELNGELLARMGMHGNPHHDYRKQPRYFPIPPHMLLSDNTLSITIHAQSAKHAGLSKILVGPESELDPIYDRMVRWHVDGFIVVLTISIVLGGMSLLLWLRQREPLYVYYGLSELLWAFRISDMLSSETFLPWPWPGLLVFSAYAASPSLICKFSLVIIDAHKGRLKQLGDWHLLLSVPVMAVAMFGRMPWLVSAWLGLTIVLCVFVAIRVVHHSLGKSSFEQRVLAVAVLLTSAAAVHDMIVFRVLKTSYGGIALVGYAWVAFGIALMWVISERLRKSALEIASVNRTLIQRLAEQEKALQAYFASRARTEKHQAIMDERQRLTRDMHDGLGSQLLGALQLAQSDATPRQMLVQQLRETLDHLKLTVDAMQDTEGDIASLLGALRYRLGPRLQAAGIQLTWSVETLPQIPNWTIQHSRDLQMILFEAFSNLIVHARASRASLSASEDRVRNQIRISLSDNGVGLPPSDLKKAAGHGIANMRTRAERIRAHLDIHSDDNGTRVMIMLPLDSWAEAA